MEINISSECKLLLHADERAILYSHKDPAVKSKNLRSELVLYSKWLADNKLSLHMGKTEYVLFGSKRKLRRVDDFCIECNGHKITTQSLITYLGL